jgi:glycosyltransferase involved in cell wall biosynthesis
MQKPLKRKKVLNIFPTTQLGGAPFNVLKLIQNQSNTINSVITSKGNKEVYLEFKKSASSVYDINIRKISLLSLLKVIVVVFKEKPDIIHAHGNAGALYTFLSSLLLFKPSKIIYTFRGFNQKPQLIKRFFQFALEWAFSFFVDRYIAVSESERKKVLKSGWFYKNKIITIPNGVEIKKEELNESKKDLLAKYDINIISISRISPQKDLETLIKAFSKLVSTSRKKIGLHIVGGFIPEDISYKKKVFKLQESLNKTNSIHFWGELPFAGNYIWNFDVFISTSLWEGLQTSLIESLLQETPTIATNVVGNKDIISDKTGYSTKAKNIDDIYKNLSLCIDELKSYNSNTRIDNGLRFAKNNFSLEKYNNNINALYNLILK